MIPESISFTGEEFVTRELTAFRRCYGPYPADWVRRELPYTKNGDRDIENWLMENITGRGRFGIEITFGKAIVYFERDLDAVQFRLRDGESICKEESLSI